MTFPWMADDLTELERQGLRRKRRLLGKQGSRVVMRGRELINFASNDYLDLSGDPRLAKAAIRAARKYGVGAGASPLVSGHLPPHRRLERALGEFEHTEAALVLTSGFIANLALISTLAGRPDAIFSDRLNHASIIDGCRLSGAAIHIYDHGDLDHLDQLLHQHGTRARRRLIATDSVFSMEGDLAPLQELATLAEQHDAVLLVDEAHATGVLGPTGRGLTEYLDPSPAAKPPGSESRLIKMATLSKALGTQGGFICGSRLLIDWLINRARPYIFSTAPAPPTCAAARRALQIVADEPERRHQVLRLASQLREALKSWGFDTGRSCCHIVPVIIGDPDETVQLSKRLQERGFLVPAIRPPSVPPGTSRLRISVTPGHHEEEILALVNALVACRSYADWGIRLHASAASPTP